jgi:proteic killer suppression protein
VIKAFRCKETEKIFKRSFSRKFPHNIQRVTLRKLKMLNRANILNDLKIPPSNRLETLRGNRKGQYSIRINDQWRICFEWSECEVRNVEIVMIMLGVSI